MVEGFDDMVDGSDDIVDDLDDMVEDFDDMVDDSDEMVDDFLDAMVDDLDDMVDELDDMVDDMNDMVDDLDGMVDETVEDVMAWLVSCRLPPSFIFWLPPTEQSFGGIYFFSPSLSSSLFGRLRLHLSPTIIRRRFCCCVNKGGSRLSASSGRHDGPEAPRYELVKLHLLRWMGG